MDLEALDRSLREAGCPPYRYRQAYHALTREGAAGWDEITTLPAALRDRLADRLPFDTVAVTSRQEGSDGTVKLHLTTHDGFPLESVLMEFHGTRNTACLSSQSGCALACTFCATGAMGFGRNLTRYEILDQLLILQRINRQRGAGRIDNVVMMGMGEPFHNYDEVLAAIRLMNDADGIALGARRIAISTVGWVPGIERLASEPLQVKLALSLHAPTDELRAELMPVNRRYPLDVLLDACRRYRSATKRRIFVEYLMLDGVNDAPAHARQLARLVGSEGFHINLISYNPTDSRYSGSPEERVRAFSAVLTEHSVASSYRISRGRDINAACGQLASQQVDMRAIRRAARSSRVTSATA